MTRYYYPIRFLVIVLVLIVQYELFWVKNDNKRYLSLSSILASVGATNSIVSTTRKFSLEEIEAWIESALVSQQDLEEEEEGRMLNREKNIPQSGGFGGFGLLQDIARKGLSKLNNNTGFQLAGIKSPLQSFHRQDAIWRFWDPCIFGGGKKKTKNNFNIVIMGGSMTARNSNKCVYNKSAATTPQDGRYSNILQYNLQSLYDNNNSSSNGNNITVHNMAQGGTTSLWSAMQLERLLTGGSAEGGIQLDEIDLIIWEYGINDFAPFNRDTAHRMLAVWLTRLNNLFATRNLSTPPILLLYFWRKNIGGISPNDLLAANNSSRLGFSDVPPTSKLFQQSLQVVDAFTTGESQHQDRQRRRRMQIQVLELSKTIDLQTMLNDRRDFLDDNQHPSCRASHLIANSISYMLFANTNPLTCSSPYSVTTTTTTTTQTRSTMQINKGKESTTRGAPAAALMIVNATNATTDLLQTLLNPRTIIQTLNNWEPSYLTSSLSTGRQPLNKKLASSSSSSLLTMESYNQTRVHYLSPFGKSEIGRDDRKYSYQIPICSSHHSVAGSPNDKDSSTATTTSTTSPLLPPLQFTISNNNNNNNNNMDQKNKKKEKDWEWILIGYTGTNIWFRLDEEGEEEHGGDWMPLSGNAFNVSQMGGPINSMGRKKNFYWTK